MTERLLLYLVLHVVSGTGAIIFLTGYLLSISKIDSHVLKAVVLSSSLGISSFLALLSIVASWIFGGIYYTSYYGKSVKPLILQGNLPWIHKIIMETKEHVFLFLPFATLAIFAVTYFLNDKLKTDEKLKKATIALCFTTVSIALAVLLAGIVVSGAVKR